MQLVMITSLIYGRTLPAPVFVKFWTPHVPSQASIFLPEVTSVRIEVCWNGYKPARYIHLVIELEFYLCPVSGLAMGNSTSPQFQHTCPHLANLSLLAKIKKKNTCYILYLLFNKWHIMLYFIVMNTELAAEFFHIMFWVLIDIIILFYYFIFCLFICWVKMIFSYYWVILKYLN